MHFPLFLAFDVALEPVSQATGFDLMSVFVAVFVAETLALWLMRWGTLGRSAVASLVMNTITTVVGVFLSLSASEALAVGFVLSVIIEGVVLMAFNRRKKLRSWAAALVANVVSYLLLFALFLVSRLS